jgi:hypothetical protein
VVVGLLNLTRPLTLCSWLPRERCTACPAKFMACAWQHRAPLSRHDGSLRQTWSSSIVATRAGDCVGARAGSKAQGMMPHGGALPAVPSWRAVRRTGFLRKGRTPCDGRACATCRMHAAASSCCACHRCTTKSNELVACSELRRLAGRPPAHAGQTNSECRRCVLGRGTSFSGAGE